jgi:hypothetical protein
LCFHNVLLLVPFLAFDRHCAPCATTRQSMELLALDVEITYYMVIVALAD